MALAHEVTCDCVRPFSYLNVIQCTKCHKNAVDSYKKLEINVSNFALNTVPADGLVPSGARPSAVTVMTKFRPIYILDQHLKV